MEIFPAIDIRDGRVVRLSEGDYDRMTIYGDSPREMAKQFIDMGARNLHVVDLDGARDGKLANYKAIEEIANLQGLFMQVGGGIRDEERIRRYLDCGVNRTILGTVAVKNYSFVEQAVARFGSAIAVGVDAKDGQVAISAWREVTDIPAQDFCRKLHESGVETVIYTDISRDGMLQGTNLDIYEFLCEIQGLKIIASGGITYEREIMALKEMGVYGAIVGKAIYQGNLSLEQIFRLA